MAREAGPLPAQRPLVAVLALALALLVPLSALSAPASSSGSYVVHAPIRIERDADFTAANGVRSGTGTPSDPYVLSGWEITAPGTGVAVLVRNVTASYVLADNLLECEASGSTCVRLEGTHAEARVTGNLLVNGGVGVRVLGVAAEVANNTVSGLGSTRGATAFMLENTNAEVTGNHVVDHTTGVRVDGGAPHVTGNVLTTVRDGILLVHAAAGARVESNRVTDAAGTAIGLRASSGVEVRGNDLARVGIGVSLESAGPVQVEANVVTASSGPGVRVTRSDATLAGNTVTSGAAGGLLVHQARVDVNGGTYSNHPGVGIEFDAATGSVVGARLDRNGGGIALTGGSAVALTDNVLTNNTYGLSIPYASRQSIPMLSGNLVNGYPVDAPGQEVFHYRAANVQVAGQVRDGGFSAGHYGALSAQGQLVLYEVDTVRVSGSVLSHGVAGVHAINSFDVAVEDSILRSNGVGLHLETVTADSLAPPCVGSVKNSTIDVPVDPPQTYGVRVDAGCLAAVLNNTIRLVDVGVHLDARARAHVANNTVSETMIGIRVDGQATAGNHAFTLENNTVLRNLVGVSVRAASPTLTGNRVLLNAEAGIRLEAGSSPVLVENNVSYNLHGVLDAQPCTTQASCSRVSARGNVLVENRGVGLWVNRSATLRGDVVLGSGTTGILVRGHAHLDGVTSIGNGRDGADLAGTFHVEGSVFTHNGRHGATLYGEGRLDASVFAHNDEAGLRVTALLVVAERLNVSHNHDGILLDEHVPEVHVEPPAVQRPDVSVGALLPPDRNRDPLFIHMSDIHHNFRNAIRAPRALVNATQNWWGHADGPAFSVPGILEYGNTIHPGPVLAYPYWKDAEKTRLGIAPRVL